MQVSFTDMNNYSDEKYNYKNKYEKLVKLLHDKMCSDNEIFEAMLPLFEPLIKHYLSRFYAKGYEKEDLYQQGLIGLYNAIKSYDYDGEKNFYFLARRCIRLSILNLVRATTSKRHKFNIEAMSLDSYRDKSNDNSSKLNLYDIVVSGGRDPEKIYIEDEHKNELSSQINVALTRLEATVLKEYLEGYSYGEIARNIGVKSKTVDNALNRTKKKLKLILDESKIIRE